MSRGRPTGSPLRRAVLQHLAEEGRTVLDLKRDRAWLEDLTPDPETLIRRIREQGLLHTIQRGRYQVNVDGRPSRRPRLEALDPLATAILGRLDIDYYLSWHSALWHYGLIDQQASRLFVAVKEARKRPAHVGIYDIRFVTVTAKRFFGYEVVHDFDVPLPIAQVEKALIDSFDRPKLAAPVPVVANAMRNAWQAQILDVERLVAYAITFDSKAVVRRVGFFMELYDIPGSEQLEAHIGRKSAMPLAPGREPPAPRRVNSRWLVYEDPAIVGPARSLK
jgi:predicted transcriptional regulator of viral defense system